MQSSQRQNSRLRVPPPKETFKVQYPNMASNGVANEVAPTSMIGLSKETYPSFDDSRYHQPGLKGSQTQRDRSSSKNLSKVYDCGKPQNNGGVQQLKSLSQMKEYMLMKSQGSHLGISNSGVLGTEGPQRASNQSQFVTGKQAPNCLISQKENLSVAANQSKRLSHVIPKKSQPQQSLNLVGPGVNSSDVQMQIFMNHPAFQKQRSRLVTLAPSESQQSLRNSGEPVAAASTTQKRRMSQTHSGVNKGSKVARATPLTEQPMRSDIECSRPEVLNVIPKHYDFSSLDLLDNLDQERQHTQEATIHAQSLLVDNRESLTHMQSFDNILLDLTKVIPSVQCQSAMHNTVQTKYEDFVQSSSIQNIQQEQTQQQLCFDMSFSENETNRDHYSATSMVLQQLSDQGREQHATQTQFQDKVGMSRDLKDSQKRVYTNPLQSPPNEYSSQYFIYRSDQTPKFPDQHHHLHHYPSYCHSQAHSQKPSQTQREFAKLKEIIKRVEKEEELRQKDSVLDITKSRNHSTCSYSRNSGTLLNNSALLNNSSQMALNNSRMLYKIGKEVTTEELSPSLQPQLDLVKRNSLDLNLSLTQGNKLIQQRSRSLANLRSNLSFFKDTSTSMQHNNKLSQPQPAQQSSQKWDSSETQFKFQVFYLFMQLMRHGKDPIPFVLDLYLQQKSAGKKEKSLAR